MYTAKGLEVTAESLDVGDMGIRRIKLKHPTLKLREDNVIGQRSGVIECPRLELIPGVLSDADPMNAQMPKPNAPSELLITLIADIEEISHVATES
jgi:hypothetical protein